MNILNTKTVNNILDRRDSREREVFYTCTSSIRLIECTPCAEYMSDRHVIFSVVRVRTLMTITILYHKYWPVGEYGLGAGSITSS